MRNIFLLFSVLSLSSMLAQKDDQNLPYSQIPDYPETYTAGTVVSRMIDGLGFRYYWATEGLRPEDLKYKPSETNRSVAETIAHIHGLSKVILNSALKLPNDRTNQTADTLSFEEKRKRTLLNLKKASEIFLSSTDLSQHNIVFKNTESTVEFPFWNQINGPIEDAVWHCGQVVALRRASGNPFDSSVSVLRGVKRDF